MSALIRREPIRRKLASVAVAALLALVATGCAATQAPIAQQETVRPQATKQQDALTVARAFPLDRMLAEQVALGKTQLYASLSREFPGKDANIRIFVDEFYGSSMRDVLEDLVAVVADEFASNFTQAELQVFKRVLLSPAGQAAMQPGVPADRLSQASVDALLDLDRNVDHARMAAFSTSLGRRHGELQLLARLRAEQAQTQNRSRLSELGLSR